MISVKSEMKEFSNASLLKKTSEMGNENLTGTVFCSITRLSRAGATSDESSSFGCDCL